MLSDRTSCDPFFYTASQVEDYVGLRSMVFLKASCPLSRVTVVVRIKAHTPRIHPMQSMDSLKDEYARRLLFHQRRPGMPGSRSSPAISFCVSRGKFSTANWLYNTTSIALFQAEFEPCISLPMRLSMSSRLIRYDGGSYKAHSRQDSTTSKDSVHS